MRQKIPVGEHSLVIQINKTGKSSAKLTVSLGENSLGSFDIPKLWPIYTPNSGVRCGENRHAPISRDYKAPFVFDQQLKRIVVDVDLS